MTADEQRRREDGAELARRGHELFLAIFRLVEPSEERSRALREIAVAVLRARALVEGGSGSQTGAIAPDQAPGGTERATRPGP